jgi:hypothetical protein
LIASWVDGQRHAYIGQMLRSQHLFTEAFPAAAHNTKSVFRETMLTYQHGALEFAQAETPGKCG